MTDLTTKYLGLTLKNPLVASASPLSKKVETVKKLEDAGVSAVVMYSLFEEQINNESRVLDHFLSFGTDSFQEADSFFPEMDHYNVGPGKYLDHISNLKKAVQIPIIASLNGVSSGGWVDYAKRMEDAGADGLELNFYYVPTSAKLSSAELEKAYIRLVADIRAEIKIPLAVKLSPFYTALPQFASDVVKAGANGLVCFNRFIQPDLDIEKLVVDPTLNLSTSEELRLPLRWTAILYDRIKADLALSSGVHTAEDMVKAIMAGASVTLLASELVAKGPKRAAELISEFAAWMEAHEYVSVQQMLGSMSHKNVGDPAAFERGNYMKALQSFDNTLF